MINFRNTLDTKLIGNKDIGENEKHFIALIFNSNGQQLSIDGVNFNALKENEIIKLGFKQTSYAKIGEDYFHLTKTGRLFYLNYLNPVSLSSV